MTKIPRSIICLFSFAMGLPVSKLLVISAILFFGMNGILMAPPEVVMIQPPPMESRAFAIFLAVATIAVPILTNRWLISDSPYKFEYGVSSFLCFTIGVIAGAYMWG
ncbi:MAG TPA: hypothetical protein VE710_21105 [Candidatus Bathyarchaeia archaeon]|nr:hypothetical protein [Candidatus Bathyarchaeia archaeon]